MPNRNEEYVPHAINGADGIMVGCAAVCNRPFTTARKVLEERGCGTKQAQVNKYYPPLSGKVLKNWALAGDWERGG